MDRRIAVVVVEWGLTASRSSDVAYWNVALMALHRSLKAMVVVANRRTKRERNDRQEVRMTAVDRLVAVRKKWLVFRHQEDHKTMMVCWMEVAKTMGMVFQTMRNDLAAVLRMKCAASAVVGMRELHIGMKAAASRRTLVKLSTIFLKYIQED